jgi:AcrR family transcriptional regulator
VDRTAVSEPARGDVRLRLLQATEECLLREGYAALSTRAVAAAAETPLSQIHYHFGSKQGLVLALLDHQNKKLLRRQAEMFGADASLSARWLQACDFLDEDLASGYVRVLQEIVSAGYSDPELAAAAREALTGWFELLTALAGEARERFGGLDLISDAEVGALVGMAFLGAECMSLLAMDLPVRSALRAIGAILAKLEAHFAGDPGHAC